MKIHQHWTENKTPSFNIQIENWLSVFEDFEKLPNYHMINGWLLIDMRTFKHAILNECSKWINMFKEHLLNYVLDRLNVRRTF